MNEKQIAHRNDQRLLEAAFYYETKGMITKTPESPEEMVKFSKQVWNRFAEFKIRIKKSGVSIADIERKVFSEFGIMDTEQEQVTQFFQALTDLSRHFGPMRKGLNDENLPDSKKKKEKE